MAVHHVQLLLGIAILWFLVQRVVCSQIFVETDANGIVADNHTLIQRAYLGIDLRHLHVRNVLPKITKGMCQLLVDIIHAGILLLGLGNQYL